MRRGAVAAIRPWAAFVGVEDEVVGGDGEGHGEVAEDLEGGLVGAGFIAAQLGDVDADGVGEGLLGHAALFADRGEAVGEVHGGRYENGRISHRRHHHPPLRPRRTPDEAALGDDRIAPVAELNDEDLNLVASFIDTLVTKTRLKVLASGS